MYVRVYIKSVWSFLNVPKIVQKLLFDKNELTTQTNYSANTNIGPSTLLYNCLIYVTYDKKKRTWYNIYKIKKNK